MNYRLVCAIGFFTFAQSVFAQSDITNQELKINRSNDSSFFSPSIYAGMRGDFKSYRSNSGESVLIGPFVRPEIEFKSSEKNRYHFELKYRFTAMGGQGFGGAHTVGEFGENISLTHSPSVSVLGHLDPHWAIGTLGIAQVSTFSGDQRKNSFSIFLSPTLQYSPYEDTTLFFSYIYERFSNFDTTLGDSLIQSTDVLSAKIQKADPKVSEKDDQQHTRLMSQTPVHTLNSGQMGFRIRWNESYTSEISALMGKNTSNSPTGGTYSNALRTSLGGHYAQLKWNFLYQINADFTSWEKGPVEFKHRARFLIGIPLNKAWSFNFENMFSADPSSKPKRNLQLTTMADRPKYESDAYAGIAYNF